MRRILLLFSGLISVAGVHSQQRSHYSQYILNNYILNPALSGIENYVDIKVSARDQWIGLRGAPKTFYFTAHGALGKKDYKSSATSFAVPGENPRGHAYWESYQASEAHHGIGMAIINDKTGNFNRFSATASYAYHLGLSPRTNLSAGFAAGITTIGLNADGKAFFGDDPSDPAIGGTVAKELQRIKPDLSFGLWLYSANYFVGLAGQQIIPQKLNYVNNTTFKQTGKLIPHIFFTAGYRFMVNDDINAIPSIMFKYINGGFVNNYQAELNVKMQYRDLVWLGGSYRQFDGYAAMLGVNVANTFNVGYSYDFTKTDINTYIRGTHELVLGFLIGNRYGDTCPRNVW